MRRKRWKYTNRMDFENGINDDEEKMQQKETFYKFKLTNEFSILYFTVRCYQFAYGIRLLVLLFLSISV